MDVGSEDRLTAANSSLLEKKVLSSYWMLIKILPITEGSNKSKDRNTSDELDDVTEAF